MWQSDRDHPDGNPGGHIEELILKGQSSQRASEGAPQMEYMLVPVTWKPVIRPAFFPREMPSTLVRAKKTASVLGISEDQLSRATITDDRGIDNQHIKPRPRTYSCDQVMLLMRLLRRPGQAAFERYLLAKLEKEVAKGKWPHPYPDCFIRPDALGLVLVSEKRRLRPITDAEFERAMM